MTQRIRQNPQAAKRILVHPDNSFFRKITTLPKEAGEKSRLLLYFFENTLVQMYQR